MGIVTINYLKLLKNINKRSYNKFFLYVKMVMDLCFYSEHFIIWNACGNKEAGHIF